MKTKVEIRKILTIYLRKTNVKLGSIDNGIKDLGVRTHR